MAAGVRVDGEVLPADAVVVAMGPWSNLAAAWLPLPMAVSGLKYHSAILENPPDTEVPPPPPPPFPLYRIPRTHLGELACVASGPC